MIELNYASILTWAFLGGGNSSRKEKLKAENYGIRHCIVSDERFHCMKRSILSWIWCCNLTASNLQFHTHTHVLFWSKVTYNYIWLYSQLIYETWILLWFGSKKLKSSRQPKIFMASFLKKKPKYILRNVLVRISYYMKYEHFSILDFNFNCQLN